MAYTRGDVKRWRLDAEDAAGADLSAQRTWLRTKRQEYSPKVAAGDIEITSDSMEGGTTQAKRGLSDSDNHDAIVAAIEQLDVLISGGGKSRGTVLGFKISDITG